MARTIKADVIECRAPTLAQARRLWNETIGDGSVAITANRILIEATGRVTQATDKRQPARK